MDDGRFYYELKVTSHADYAQDGDGRLMGVFTDESVAVDVVENNRSDIWEYTYDYAMLEKYTRGLYPQLLSREVYKYDRKHNKFVFVDWFVDEVLTLHYEGSVAR